MAICQSNLGLVDKALQCLELAEQVAQTGDKGYHYTTAAIIIQNSITDQYGIAENHLNIALEVEPGCPKVFALRQHLYALMGKNDCEENVKALDSFFEKNVQKKDNEKIIADYYLTRGLIHQIYEEANAAECDYRKALTYNGENDLLLFNLLSAEYARATVTVSKTERSLYAAPDVGLLLHVREELKSFLDDSYIRDENHYALVTRAVALYVSVCSLLGLLIDLKPIEKYLPFVCDYELIRVIVLDCIYNDKDRVDLLDKLDDEDKILAQSTILLKEGKLDACKDTIIQTLEQGVKRVELPLVHMLLQIALMQNDTDKYWKYRDRIAESLPIEVLTVFDARAMAADGNVTAAQKMMDEVAAKIRDISLFINILRFYKERDDVNAYEKLCRYVVSLNKNREIVIPDSTAFYYETVSYLLSKQSIYVCELFGGITRDELSDEDYHRLQEFLCISICDFRGLYECSSYFFSKDKSVKSGINKALCQVILLDYAGAIKTCKEIENKASKEERVKIAWILSDAFFLSGDNDSSFSYAKMAHELTLPEPANESHQHYLTRAMRCGHFEGLADVVDYQNTHPIVVDWIKQIHLDPDSPPETLFAEIAKEVPQVDTGMPMDEIADIYKTKCVPINWLLQYNHGDWDRVFAFARQHKLFICEGNRNQLAAAAEKIENNILVDEQTLIILEHYGCMEILKQIQKIHICYNTVQRLQYDFYNGRLEAKRCLKWLKDAQNVEYEANGFSIDYGEIMTLVAGDLVYVCNVAREKGIPFLCADGAISVWQKHAQFELLKDVYIVSLPTLLAHMEQSENRSELVCRLLQDCIFVSFDAQTMVDHISKAGYAVTDETSGLFLNFNSECDPNSFAVVYLQAVDLLLKRNRTAAINLSKQLVEFTRKVWKRGGYYRYSSGSLGVPNDYSRPSAIITTYCVITMVGIWMRFQAIDVKTGTEATRLLVEIGEYYGVDVNTLIESVWQNFRS